MARAAAKAVDPGVTLQFNTPRVFVPLLTSARFRGAKGGRGSGKSHFFAESLIEDMVLGHTRAACVREIQNSIKDSVKQLIQDKIERHGLRPLFKITDREIVGPNDGLIVFRGLQNHTATSIKSLEGFNRCLVEEAQTITRRSLDLLVPTFRSNSQFSFAWNPNSPKDAVETLFADNKGDSDFACVHANYYDNPFFPAELRRDMERDKYRDPDKYAHVWLGDFQQKSEARVFRNWRVGELEIPAGARPYFGADWGFSVDPTVLIRVWVWDRTLYVDREVYRVGCEIDHTPALFERVNDGRITTIKRWPITADSARPETISYMKRQGYNIKPARKGAGSVEEGIEFLKSYDIVVHPDCAHSVDEMSLYAYEIDKKTNEVLPVLSDRNNHVIDAIRYAVEGLRSIQAPMKISDGALKLAGVRRNII